MPSFQMYFIFTLSNLNRAENIITVEKIVIIIIIVNNCYVILFPAVCLDLPTGAIVQGFRPMRFTTF